MSDDGARLLGAAEVRELLEALGARLDARGIEARVFLVGGASFSVPGIRVGVASAEYLFAMKAMAARQEIDGADLRVLARSLGIAEVSAALALVERFYGRGRLTAKTRLIVEGVLSDGTR